MNKICPRCHKPYSTLSREKRKGRYYFYAIHVENGERKKCYLGPLKYEYGLKFNIFVDNQQFIYMLHQLLNKIKGLELSDKERKIIVRMLREILDHIETKNPFMERLRRLLRKMLKRKQILEQQEILIFE